MTQSWSGGYVADIAYIEGFYLQQSPPRMALACLLGGVQADIPRPDDAAHYLELGCGLGVGALLTAAANPAWRVTAIDYNPAHIAIASALARAARIDNIRFLEADLASLSSSALGQTIPAADFISMHGLWSWVGPEVRAGIVRLLADKTAPGGLVHVSYNTLPGWQGALGMQRIIFEAGRRADGRSDHRAMAGLALARELKEAEAKYLIENPLSRELIDGIGTMSSEYVSHEYMNSHWAPAFHADVARDMAGAKLDWVASGNPLENFSELMLTAEQRAVMNRYDDPIMRELIKDCCIPRQLRHDVYVRGARRLRNDARDAALAALTIAPIINPDELQTAIQVPAGKAEMSETLKGMMEAAMLGPATIGELLAGEPGRSSPGELIAVLVGSYQCQIVPSPGASQPQAADRLNRVIGARVHSIVGPSSSGGLAATQLGTGLVAAPIMQFIAARLLAGEREDAADAWIATLSADVPQEQHETVRSIVANMIAKRVPILRRLGIVPG